MKNNLAYCKIHYFYYTISMLFNKCVLSFLTTTTVEIDKFLSSQKVPSCHFSPFLWLQRAESQLPNQRSNPCPLHWMPGVSTPGLPGKSL